MTTPPTPADRPTVRITYDNRPGAADLARGAVLVSMRRGSTLPLSVYLVVSARRVASVKHLDRWALEVLPAPELRSAVQVVERRLMVRDTWAYPLYWASRKKR